MIRVPEGEELEREPESFFNAKMADRELPKSGERFEYISS